MLIVHPLHNVPLQTLLESSIFDGHGVHEGIPQGLKITLGVLFGTVWVR